MKEILPEKLKTLARSLSVPLYVVGGACRDYIAELTATKRDWDICAPLGAEALSSAAERAGFKVGAIYKNTGTVRLSCEGEEYEFTSFRTDRYVRGVHSPAQIYFTDDICSDARRRDFKCNAVYYDVAGESFVDPLGGIEEIKSKTISTVVDAKKVFGEDGLRLMRLCRIAAQTGFTPTAECLAGAIKNRSLIDDIAAERIWAELDAILHADQKYGIVDGPYTGLELLKITGVLGHVLPELAAGEYMLQRKDFHDHDVLEHTFRCVRYADDGIRLAALLHDVGKPYCRLTTGNYARHEEEGERIAAAVMARLKVPTRLASRTCELIRWHMYDLGGVTSETKVRKFIVNHLGCFDDLLLLKQADFSACKDNMSTAPCVKRWKGIYSKMLEEGVPMTLKALNVRGDELIEAGIYPDEAGKTLKFLLGECAAGNLANSKPALIKCALSYVHGLRAR